MAEAGTTAAPAAQPGQLVDPYRAYNFKLLIKNVTEGHFTEVQRPRRARSSASPTGRPASTRSVRAVPGQVSVLAGDAALRPDLVDDLWDWLMERASRAGRRDASLDRHARPQRARPRSCAGTCRSAWPCEWHGAPLDASSRELAIETLILAHEGIERDRP